jgi:sphingomyelin phosphodiesterase acid-like 3
MIMPARLICVLAVSLFCSPGSSQGKASPVSKFLWLSDIHLNPFDDPALVHKLASAPPSEWAEILNTSANTRFSTYSQDTNWRLLSSALAAIKQTLPEPAFTIVTGDLLAHDFRQRFNASATVHDDAAYRQFVDKTVEFVTAQLKQLAPNSRTIVALGNNDSDCGNYLIQPQSPFLRDTAPLIADLAESGADPAFAADWNALGSYNVPHPILRKHRIIALNTSFFSSKHENACNDTVADPGQDMLSWLDRQLANAKRQGEKVWLIYHIPPGIDGYSTATSKPPTPGNPVLMWKPAYSSGFNALLERFDKSIAVSFAAHTHVDDFRLANRRRGYRSLVFMEPAVSPVYDQNPAFRVVSLESNGKLRDHATYYLKNLANAGPATAPEWTLEYRFDEAWGLKRPDLGAYRKVWSRAGKPGKQREQWVTFYSVNHPGSTITPEIFSQLYCATGNTDVPDYEKCVASQRSH